MKVSARALGVLFVLVDTGVQPSAKNLSEVVTEGRDALRTAIRELVNAGYLTDKKIRVGSRIMREIRVTPAGYERVLSPENPHVKDLKIRSMSQQSQLYNLNNPISNITKVVLIPPDGGEVQTIQMGENMPYDFFKATSSGDDKAEEREKYLREKREKYVREKQSRQQKAAETRKDYPKKLWSAKDSAMEFFDRCQAMWNIPPWSAVKSSFIPALSGMRDRLNTDGEVECVMMDLYFKSVESERFESGDHAWKIFINRAPNLVVIARASMTSPEEEMAAQAAADKSWDWMEE